MEYEPKTQSELKLSPEKVRQQAALYANVRVIPTHCPGCGYKYPNPGYETSWHWRNCRGRGPITHYRPLTIPMVKFPSRLSDFFMALLLMAAVVLALMFSAIYGQHRQCRELQREHAPQWQQHRVCP